MKSAAIALVLLAVVTSASAECAWVLWLNIFDTPSGIETYSIDSAHATRQECGESVRDSATVLRGKGYKVEGGFSGSYEAIGTKGTKSWKYTCLPDTIDPRGPKGK